MAHDRRAAIALEGVSGTTTAHSDQAADQGERILLWTFVASDAWDLPRGGDSRSAGCARQGAGLVIGRETASAGPLAVYRS